MEVESVKFKILSGTISGAVGNFIGQWIVNFDGSKSVRKLKPVIATATIIANTTIPTAASTTQCLGSVGGIGQGDANYLAKWATATEISKSNVYQDPLTGNIGIGTTTPVANFEVNGALRVGDSAAACTAAIEGMQKYNYTKKNYEYCDGISWKSMGGSLESFVSRSGENKRCKNDEWVFYCGYRPDQLWNYNVCYSRGHALYYKYILEWNSSAKGYRLKCLSPSCAAWSYPYNVDAFCNALL